MPFFEKKPRIIGIVGSRRRDSKEDEQLCRAEFRRIFRPGDQIVSGGCPKGGDRFAQILAQEFGLTITIHYPDWNANGKAAGFVRNQKIADDCDVLIALVASDRKGGTEDTVEKAIVQGKTVCLV